MLHEIENVEREIRAREDLILVEMEQAEELAATSSAKSAPSRPREAPQRAQGSDERREASKSSCGLTAERDRDRAKSPRPRRELFKRMAKVAGRRGRRGEDEMCQVCHVKLRPQMYVELKPERGDHAVPRVQPDPLLRAAVPGGRARSRDGRPESSTSTSTGRSRGNPGDAGFGVYVRRPTARSAADLYGYLGRATNNVAEYQALLHALRYALDPGRHRVRSSPTPSSWCKQMDGRYRVKHPDMIPLHREATAAPATVSRTSGSPTCVASRTRGRPPRQPGRGREGLEAPVAEPDEVDHPPAPFPSRR